jgi:serum/glucocorticoid-regulated kinase 2
MPFWKKSKDPNAPKSPAGAYASAHSEREREPEPEPVVEDEESPYFGNKVSKDSFELIKTLGKGSFGHVMLVRKNGSGELLAMKVLQKTNLIKRRQVEHTRAERSIMQRIRGVPFLVSPPPPRVHIHTQTAATWYLYECARLE